MHLDYYNITKNPFRINRDETSLWLGGNLSKVASTLKEAIMERKGIISLTGDGGTGKSIILKMITDNLQNESLMVTLSNPELTCRDFFNVLSVRFGFKKEFKSKSAFLVHLRNYLRDSHSINKNIFLIINQADRLKIELFEELALLSDIELNDRKMISILLVGQKGWNEESMQRNAKAISNRIALECNLDPLNEEDTASYINYCLATAGANKNIFNGKTIHEIFSFSRGNLNLINSICDCALKKGYKYRKKTINPAIVKECEKELQEKTTINEDVPLSNKVALRKIKKGKKNIAAGYTVSPRRWIGLKSFFVILFIFSSYLLYKSQTEDSSIWRTDEIALKEYDFHKLKEKEAISTNIPREINENFSGSAPQKQASNLVSPNRKNEGLEDEDSATEKRQGPDEPTKPRQEWPFATFKKIVYFQYDSNTLPPDSLEILDKIADFAIHNPDREFIVKGYTDSTGAYSYNLTISKFRADSVKNYLIAKGVNPTKLDTFGLGSQDPIFSNRTAGGRKLNRRVEIELKLE